jgi:hypothetical protein
MRVFKCRSSGAECLCDAVKDFSEKDGMFVVKGRYKEIGGEDFGIAANADEDAAEGAAGEESENKKQKVIDIIYDNQLQEATFTKADYGAYIKGYMKALMEKVKAEQGEEYAKAFAANAQAFVKKVVSEFNDWAFYYPNMSSDEANYDECIVIHCKWEDETTPVFYYFKDGLKAEKV